MARFDLTGKVALIAGASRGIGAAIAHGFAEHGATVICSSRKQADCEKVAEAIRAKGGKAVSAESLAVWTFLLITAQQILISVLLMKRLNLPMTRHGT